MGCCLESIKSFFCRTDNRAIKFISSHEGQDKVAKFAADGLFPLITEVARMSDASERTMSNIGIAHDAVKLTRDVTGTLNIFRGVIPRMVQTCKRVYRLIIGLFSNTDVELDSSKQVHVNDLTNTNDGEPPLSDTPVCAACPKYNAVAVGTAEKLLKLGENTAGMVGALTFTAGFGCARPAANARKYLDVQYGNAGNRIADSFPYIMAVNHMSVTVQNCFELAYQFKAYERAMNSGDSGAYTTINKEFSVKVANSVMVLAEKTLELVNDTLFLLSVAAPPAVKIPLGLGISGLGLIRVWRKTT